MDRHWSGDGAFDDGDRGGRGGGREGVTQAPLLSYVGRAAGARKGGRQQSSARWVSRGMDCVGLG